MSLYCTIKLYTAIIIKSMIFFFFYHDLKLVSNGIGIELDMSSTVVRIIFL